MIIMSAAACTFVPAMVKGMPSSEGCRTTIDSGAVRAGLSGLPGGSWNRIYYSRLFRLDAISSHLISSRSFPSVSLFFFFGVSRPWWSLSLVGKRPAE